VQGQTYFFAAAFCFAQRLRCASTTAFRPAALMVLFFRTGGAVRESAFRGCPLRFGDAVPAMRELRNVLFCIRHNIAYLASREFSTDLLRPRKPLNKSWRKKRAEFPPCAMQALRLNVLNYSAQLRSGFVCLTLLVYAAPCCDFPTMTKH
jgi:hypothetical protein